MTRWCGPCRRALVRRRHEGSVASVPQLPIGDPAVNVAVRPACEGAPVFHHRDMTTSALVRGGRQRTGHLYGWLFVVLAVVLGSAAIAQAPPTAPAGGAAAAPATGATPAAPGGAAAAGSQKAPAVPQLPGGLANEAQPQELVLGLRIILGLAVLSLAPSLLMMLTSFTRIVIILGFLRQALGVQQTPPNTVLLGLALFLTFFIMQPVWQQVNAEAVGPYMDGKINYQDAFTRAAQPIREFMFKQTRDKDLALFINLAQLPITPQPDDMPLHVLVPAFMISELKSAFQISFVLFIPFLVIDLVVASSLMSMGMFMLPPVMISLPFKILLFVMIDGWYLIIKSVVLSFQ